MSDSRATPQSGDPRLRPQSAEVAVSGRLKADRSRLPAVGPAPRFRFPAIQKSSLPNGLRVWTVPQTTLPIATLTLLMRRGAAMDPPGREGLAALTLDMLTASWTREAVGVPSAELV